MTIDYQKLASALADELEERGLVGEGDDIIHITKYAHEKGVDRSTVYRRAKRHGIPIRDFTGAKKKGGNGGAFVSRLEMECREELGTQAVRRANGQYE